MQVRRVVCDVWCVNCYVIWAAFKIFFDTQISNLERDLAEAMNNDSTIRFECRTISPHVTRHTSVVRRHTSHITHHTPHITHHTSHVTRHTSLITGINFRLSNWGGRTCAGGHNFETVLFFLISKLQGEITSWRWYSRFEGLVSCFFIIQNVQFCFPGCVWVAEAADDGAAACAGSKSQCSSGAGHWSAKGWICLSSKPFSVSYNSCSRFSIALYLRRRSLL